jgi:hypothetical protein
LENSLPGHIVKNEEVYSREDTKGVAEGTNNKDVKYMEMKARCYSSDNGRMR